MAERGCSNLKVASSLKLKYAIIHQLRKNYSIKFLCDRLDINRSSYYKWLKSDCGHRQRKKREKLIKLINVIHENYPTYGYRRIGFLVRKRFNVSDQYIYKCCSYLGIKSKVKRNKSRNKPLGINKYDNLVNNKWNTLRPLEIVISDTTTINHCTGEYNLTLYIDAFNNEIISYDLTEKGHEELSSHLKALTRFIKIKKSRGYFNIRTILHTDQGAIYASDVFNAICKNNNIIHSMSRLGKPTDNAKIEAINGWIKQEMETDFHFFYVQNIAQFIKKYVNYYNTERPSYKLGNKTPLGYRLDCHFK